MTNSTLKDEELYQRLQQHDHFFHRCVQMIPHELYKHTESLTGYRDDSDEEDEENEDNQANSKYYKHRKQPLTADERKLKSVENKKRKYSSENAKSETAPEEDDDEDEEEVIEEVDGDSTGEPIQKKQKLLSGAAVASGDKLDELRKKLQERISSLKQQRETKKPHKLQKQQQQKQQQQANKNKEKEKKNNPTQKKPSSKPLKANQAEDNLSANGRSVEALENTIDRLRSELLSNKRDYSDETEPKPVASSSTNQDFEFNQIHQVASTSADYQKAGIPNAGGTKKQRLQRLLQEAEKKRQRYQQLASSENPVEKQKLQSEQWNDVLASAAGKKTILVSGTSNGGDNLQMVSKSEIKIKKALKKLEKKKEKSAKEWKDRLDTLDNEKQEKLAKREENIQKYKKHNNNIEPSTIESSSSNNNNSGHGNKNKPSVKISRPGQSNQNNSHHKKDSHDNHHGGGSHQSHGQKKPNRAGFEGKKSDGKFLNAK